MIDTTKAGKAMFEKIETLASDMQTKDARLVQMEQALKAAEMQNQRLAEERDAMKKKNSDVLAQLAAGVMHPDSTSLRNDPKNCRRRERRRNSRHTGIRGGALQSAAGRCTGSVCTLAAKLCAASCKFSGTM